MRLNSDEHRRRTTHWPQIEKQVDMASRHDRMTLHNRAGVTVLDLGEMDIWDGADLSLLRETLSNLIIDQECKQVGVDLSYVKYIPSGFFGMLFDWYDKGAKMFVYTPQPNVCEMLWFRQFFDHVGDGCFELLSEPKETIVSAPDGSWTNKMKWDSEELEEVFATMDKSR